MSLKQAIRARFRSPEKQTKETEGNDESSFSANWKQLEEEESSKHAQEQTSADEKEIQKQSTHPMAEEQEVYETQLTQLQEQLVAAMIENQTLASELESLKGTKAMMKLQHDLECERDKSQQLTQQLETARAQVQRSKRSSDSDDVDVAHEATEDLDLSQSKKSGTAKTSWQRLNEWLVCTFYELTEDFSDVPLNQIPKPEDPLAVKKLKDNIKRFKDGTTPIYRTASGVHGIFAWKHPAYSFIVLLVYMYSVWIGWLLPVVLFVLNTRLFINYLKYRGIDLNIRFFTEQEEESDRDSESFSELKVTDKFTLVLQVAKQVQNKLGFLSDSLEKLKNLFLWKQPEATFRLFSALIVAFIFSCILPGSTLFTIVGLYMGFKMFVIEYIHTRYPRFKERHDTVHKIWQTLPTDAELEKRNQKAQIDRQILHTMEWSYEEGSAEEAVATADLSRQDRNFCEKFSLPLAERPLAEWRGGRRCTIINKEKPLMSSFKHGRIYLSRSFLCFELAKPSSTVKDLTVPLADITKVNKAKPFGWMPGAGMSLEVTVVDSEKPYLFGALLSRDDCYENIMTHAAKVNLPWASAEAKSKLIKESKSSNSPQGAAGGSMQGDGGASSIGSQPLRMSSLKDVDDEDLLGFVNEF